MTAPELEAARGPRVSSGMKIGQFTPKDAKSLGWGWAILGLALLAFVAAMAISHYVFHLRILEGHTNHLASESLIAVDTIGMGSGAAFFAVSGLCLIRWADKKLRQNANGRP